MALAWMDARYGILHNARGWAEVYVCVIGSSIPTILTCLLIRSR